MFKFYKHKIIVHKKEYEHFHIRLTQTSFAAKNILCIINVAIPRFLLRNNSTHACAADVVSTTIKSSPPQAVDTATSYFAANKNRYLLIWYSFNVIQTITSEPNLEKIEIKYQQHF